MTSSFSIDNPDQLLTEQQAAKRLNISVRTLQAWRVRGGGPVYIKMGRSVRYRLNDLMEWVDTNMVRHTSEAGQ